MLVNLGDKTMVERSIKKASTYYLVGNIFNKGITFLTVPIFTRILSTSDYGIVTTYNSWVGILSMVIGFALHMSIRMAAVDYKEKFNDFVSSIILFVTLTSTVMIAITATVMKVLHIDISIILVVLCMLQAYATATIEDYSNYLMMQYRYRFRTALMVLPNLVSAIFSVLAILFVFTSEQFLGRIIPTAIVTFFFGIIVLMLTLKKGKCKINLEYIKYAMTISAPLILHGIALNILSQSDRIMITALADSAQTGIYSLIYNFGMIATVITTALEGVWVPWFIMKLNSNKRTEIESVANDYIHFMTYAMGCLILVAPEVVKILANKNYWEGISIIPPIVLANYIIFAYSLYVNIEQFYKKTLYISLNTIIAAVSNIVLNYIFIPKYGYVAAAFTTVVSYLISFFLHSRYARKLEPTLYPMQKFFVPLLHLTVITILFYMFQENGIVRWIGMIAYIIVILFKERKRIMFYFPEISKKITKKV